MRAITGPGTPLRAIQGHRGQIITIDVHVTPYRAMEDYGTSLRAIVGNGIPLRAFKSHKRP